MSCTNTMPKIIRNTYTQCNKIDLKFVSIDQDSYQCKVFTSIAYPSLNENKHL